MASQSELNKGIIAYITSDQSRYLGGMQLSLLAKNDAESMDIAAAIAKIFEVNIVQLPTGDYLVIKK